MPQEISSSPRPGEKALAVMKLVSEVGVFKKPLSPAKKTKSKDGRPKNVLEEEKYLDGMGKIIQRDFFPDLEKLKAQNEYLEALDRNDMQKLRELYAKYSSGSRPPTENYGASPATFETPLDARREEDESANTGDAEPRVPVEGGIPVGEPEYEGGKPSLDEYLATFTSEDNQSFQEIMHEADLKHRHKYAWLYETEEKSMGKQKDMLALPSVEEQAEEKDRPFHLDTWGYKNKNYIMYVPDGVALTAEEQVEMAKRKQEIAHANTRLQRNPFNEQQIKETTHQLAQSQAVALEGKIGVDGKEVTLSGNTPRINGYGFVKTPSPAPGVADSPLMTWGVIEGTPFRLDGGDTPVCTTPGPSFRILEPPKREKLALALAEKAGERHRDRKNKAIEAARKQFATPSPRPGSALSLDRLSTMSPAARQLATSQLRRLGSDRALQASYSPRNTTPKTPLIGGSPKTLSGCRTPGSTSRAALAKAVRRKGAGTPNPNLTDNLLNLPKRPRASDFFEPVS